MRDFSMSSTPPDTSNVVALVIKRRPGRPKIVRPVPGRAHDESDYVHQVAMAADEFIKSDRIVKSCGDAAPGVELKRLDALITGLAEEQAALLFDRLRLQQECRGDPAMVSSRRVDALMRLASLVVQREEAKRTSGELDEKLVLKLVHHLVATTEDVVREVADPALADAFMRSLNASVAGATWSTSDT